MGTAQGNGVGAYPGGDAVRLLRAVNAIQAHGRVGSIVVPFAVARDAGLRPGTERYEEAVWRLLVGGGRWRSTAASRRGWRRGCPSAGPRTA